MVSEASDPDFFERHLNDVRRRFGGLDILGVGHRLDRIFDVEQIAQPLQLVLRCRGRENDLHVVAEIAPQQLPGSIEGPQKVRHFRVALAVLILRLVAHSVALIADQAVEELGGVHADGLVDPPGFHPATGRVERVHPRRHMGVIGVHQRPVDVEQDCGDAARDGRRRHVLGLPRIRTLMRR